MAQVLSGKVPDTSNNTIVNKPQVNSRAPNVATQGEADHTVYNTLKFLTITSMRVRALIFVGHQVGNSRSYKISACCMMPTQ